MIYAKETEGSARAVLGNEKYDAIAKQTGLPGGQGHKLYEEIRVLNVKGASPADLKKVEDLKNQSRNYYKNFAF